MDRSHDPVILIALLAHFMHYCMKWYCSSTCFSELPPSPSLQLQVISSCPTRQGFQQNSLQMAGKHHVLRSQVFSIKSLLGVSNPIFIRTFLFLDLPHLTATDFILFLYYGSKWTY